MLQEADIGIKISGVEGMLAVMSTDIAIAQFRFLERLLLVHGHWCYRRISSMICYFYYKNLTFGFTIFFYEAYASFSGQPAYNDWYQSLYNVFFTSLPAIAMGVFDQDVSAKLCLKLDGNARLVLKNLLDVATQKALKAYAELIAAGLESQSSFSPSQLLQSNDPPKEQSAPQQNIPMTSDDSESFVTASDVSESLGTDPFSDQKRNLEQSRIQNVDASAPQYIKKRCRLCKKSSIKKLESINSQNETERSLWEYEREPGSVTDIGGIYDCGDETLNEPKETYCLSKEASDATKEIELCISTLQLGADHQYLFEKRSFQHKDAVPGTNSGNPCLRAQPGALLHVESSQSNVPKDQGTHDVISEETYFPYDILSSFNLAQHINGTLHLTSQQFTRKIGQTWGSRIPDELREPIEERPIENVNQKCGQKVKAIIDRMESAGKTSYRDFVTRETPNAQNIISAPSEMESPDKSPTVAMKDKRSRHMIFPQHKHSNNSKMELMSTTGNVPDWKAYGIKRSPSSRRGITVLNKNTKYESETESTTASYSSYSSNSNSQQNSGDIEEYSLPRRTYRLRSLTPSTSTNSVASHSSYETESKYGSSTSNTEDDKVYSSTSNRSREVTSSTGSKTEEYSTEEQSIPSRNHKPAKGTNRIKKQSGTWNRLKDKLAIIFHHHHHHHHHHHRHQNNKENVHYKGKSFISRRKAEAYGEKAVEKIKKSIVNDKKRQNHFHGIMEAVLRHVHHSKKSKSGGKMVPLDKVQHGNKKLPHKSQWWKVLQHHRRVNLPSKARVKIGVGKKKPRLKALPTIK